MDAKPLKGRPSFQVERRGKDGRSSSAAPLQRRATLDLGAGPGAQRHTHVSPEPQAPQGYGQAQLYSPRAARQSQGVDGTDDLFAPIDPQLRSSRLINPPFSPPPRIPDLTLAADRGSWASLHRHVSNARPPKSEAAEECRPNPSASTTALSTTLAKGKSNPNITTDDLPPPPPLNDNRHPDSPHSIPKWGIANGAPRGPGLIMSGSPTDDSPLSLPRTMLTVANPDMMDSEGESASPQTMAKGGMKDTGVPPGIPGPNARSAGPGADRRNRALPPNPPMSPPLPPAPQILYDEPTKRESVKPLVVKKEQSRASSPVKPSASGRESPTKRAPRERERGRDRESRREQSPVKPVRRTEPLKDHSAVSRLDLTLFLDLVIELTLNIDERKGA
jgi:hypothetical protein